MMFLSDIKMITAGLILVTTIAAGFYPFKKRFKDRSLFHFPIGEALAAGVFLGAGLIHMLGDAANDFNQSGIDYPVAFLLAGATFLALLWLEHLGSAFYLQKNNQSPAFAIIAAVMLIIHSLLEGTALGLSTNLSLFAIILFAILAHKWAASFALAIQLNKTHLKLRYSLGCFILFALMTPLGILFGDIISSNIAHTQLLEPIFSSLAAGTFLYLGTLHGLNRAVLIEKCCDLKHYTYVVLGFALMAVVAIWT